MVLIEFVPFFGRLELVHGRWKSVTFPPNMGGTRDIPKGAVFHDSVRRRMSETSYRPKNLGIEGLEAPVNNK